MKLYELNYLISPESTLEEAEGFCQRVNSLISKKGKIIKSSTPNKKSLSYPIKKQNLAFLAQVEFYFNPQEIEELKKEIKKEKKILRFIIIKKRIPKVKTKKPEFKLPLKEKIETPQKKAELEKIEEKLDKIL